MKLKAALLAWLQKAGLAHLGRDANIAELTTLVSRNAYGVFVGVPQVRGVVFRAVALHRAQALEETAEARREIYPEDSAYRDRKARLLRHFAGLVPA